MGKHGHRRRGQATVEFALCAVLLLTVLCAIFELSWVFHNYSYLNNALSKAARLAVTAGRRDVSITDVEREVVEAVGGLEIGAPRVTTYDVDYATAEAVESTAPWPPHKGQWVRVSAEIDYPNLSPLSTLISFAMGSKLVSTCTLPVE